MRWKRWWRGWANEEIYRFLSMLRYIIEFTRVLLFAIYFAFLNSIRSRRMIHTAPFKVYYKLMPHKVTHLLHMFTVACASFRDISINSQYLPRHLIFHVGFFSQGFVCVTRSALFQHCCSSHSYIQIGGRVCVCYMGAFCRSIVFFLSACL